MELDLKRKTIQFPDGDEGNEPYSSCPNCGGEYVKYGAHWERSSECSHPEYTSSQKEALIGLLMGDGHVIDEGNNNSFVLNMVSKPFVEWFSEQMGVLFTSPRLARTAEQSGIYNDSPDGDYHDVYEIRGRSHPYFNQLREEFYSSGEKSFPKDIYLTPTIAKFWYVSDGYLSVEETKTRSLFGVTNEKHREEYLINLFKDVGFNPSLYNDELCFGVADTVKFLHWIGEALPGFEYKWATESREKFLELKEASYQ